MGAMCLWAASPTRLKGADVNFNEFSRDDWILAGVALLLVIDLLFLPWFSISVGPFSFTTTATGSLDGWTAILAVLACILIIIDIAVERLSPATTVPTLGDGRARTRFVLAAVAAGFVALKFVLHIHFSDFGSGFYAGIVLAALLVVAAGRIAGGRSLYRPEVR
jgi:hypothetical protein